MGAKVDVVAERRNFERRLETCRHFNGIQNGRCDAGVEYATVRDETKRPGWPCLDPAVTTCTLCVRYTAEEAEQIQRDQDASLQRVLKARAAIVEATGGKRGLRGAIACPNCGGTLSYSVAGSNGHIWAACSTKECASWME